MRLATLWHKLKRSSTLQLIWLPCVLVAYIGLSVTQHVWYDSLLNKHDYPMLDGTIRLARRGQPIVVTPFTLAGAMAPVTMAGAVTLSLAEGLAAIAMIQSAARNSRTIFPVSQIPNQMMTSGINANGGTGRMNSTIGSNQPRNQPDRPIA